MIWRPCGEENKPYPHAMHPYPTHRDAGMQGNDSPESFRTLSEISPAAGAKKKAGKKCKCCMRARRVACSLHTTTDPVATTTTHPNPCTNDGAACRHWQTGRRGEWRACRAQLYPSVSLLSLPLRTIINILLLFCLLFPPSCLPACLHFLSSALPYQCACNTALGLG